MKRFFPRFAAVFLLLAVAVTALPLSALAAGGAIDPIVTSYEVRYPGSAAVRGSVERGDPADIILNFMDVTVTTDKVASADEIRVTRLPDSFSNATSIEKEITSTGTDPLAFRLTFRGVVYSGTGKDLKMILGYNGAYDTNFTQTIAEAVEFK